MADEIVDTTEELDEAIEPGEHEEPTPLPDDPTEKAAELEKRLAASAEDNRRIQRELEREREYAKEQEAGKQTWFRKHEEVVGELNKRTVEPKKAEEVVTDILDDPLFVNKETGRKLEVGDLVTSGITTEKLVNKIVDLVQRHPKIVTTDKLDKRVQQERESQTLHGKALVELAKDYPALREPDSELMTETATVFTQLENDRPELSDADRWELAAARAARKINYDPKATKAKPNGNGERERLKAGQGGPTGGTRGKGTVPQITDEMRKTFKRGNGGVEVPDKVIMDSLKRQTADREAQRRA